MPGNSPPQADAPEVFFCPPKHSLQKTGLPWVGRKGNTVSFPQLEQTAIVSCLVKLFAPARPGARFSLQVLQRLGRFLNCLSWKKSCSPAVNTKSSPQSTHFSTLSWNSMGSPFSPNPQHCQDSTSLRLPCTPELGFRLRDCANDCGLLCGKATQALLELLLSTKVTAYSPASYTGKGTLSEVF